MFRIVCNPSSGSIELYLTEIRSGSLMFVLCLVGVWQRNFEPVVCMCTVRRAAARRTVHIHTHTHTHNYSVKLIARILHYRP